jgi:hypothetical protein
MTELLSCFRWGLRTALGDVPPVARRPANAAIEPGEHPIKIPQPVARQVSALVPPTATSMRNVRRFLGLPLLFRQPRVFSDLFVSLGATFPRGRDFVWTSTPSGHS